MRTAIVRSGDGTRGLLARQGPWVNPLLEILQTMKEYADAQPGPTTELGPQTRTLLQVFTGAGSFEPE